MFSLGLSLPTIAGQGRLPPWFRAPAHLLDGVAPGVFADVSNARHALAGIDGRALSELLVNTNASTACTRIDASGRVVACAAGELRIDWTNGVPELLAEGPATNLVLYAGDPTNAANWTTSDATRTNGVSGPAGGNLGSRVTCTASGSGSWSVTGAALGYTTTSGTTYTFSRFVRAGTQSLVQLTAPSSTFGAAQYANFDVSAGTILSSAGCTPRIVKLASGWRRISVTVTATASGAATGGQLAFLMSDAAQRLPAVSLSTWFDEAFPQVEVGGFATSYVPTPAASAVTRAADLIQMTPAAASVLQGSGAALAWRGVVPVAISACNMLNGTGGSYLTAAASQLLMTGNSSPVYLDTAAVPGDIGACLGWGASGRGGANKAGAVAESALPSDRSLSSVYIGPATGLVPGQILRLRQLVGWSLSDRPSAAGVQFQTRLAA